jgi:hypothetical protein
MIDKREFLQWFGAVFVIFGHIFNAFGVKYYPFNIMMFTVGTVCFLIWSVLVKNKPQTTVNIIAIVACITGLVNSFA